MNFPFRPHRLFRLAALFLFALPLFADFARPPFIPVENVLVLDESSSMEDRFPGFGLEVLASWRTFEGKKAGAVSVGRHPSPTGGGPREEDRYTDLSAALQAAAALFSPPAKKRVLLASDGLSFTEEPAEILRRLQEENIKVFALSPPVPQRQVGVTDIVLPLRAFLWEPFSVKGRIMASRPGKLSVLLRRNGVVIDEKQVDIDSTGLAEVSFTQEADRVGTIFYTLEIKDAPAAAASGEVQIGASPRLRYIGTDLQAAGRLIGLFREMGVDVRTSRPADIFLDEDAFAKDDIILLDDLPSPSLSDALMERIRLAVGDGGKGLLVIGGRKGLGSDSYRDTLLESILPVTVGFSAPPDPLAVSMVIAMDTSFSMFFRGRGKTMFTGNDPRKIDVAKESAREVVRIIRPEDRLGIIGNSTDLFWIQKLGPVENAKDVMARIDPVTPTGDGLNFFSIVREAYQSLRRSPTPLKHVLVLGDAEDIDQHEVVGEGHSFDLIRRMVKEGITLTVLAFGQPTDKDVPFLRTATLLGKGDFYLISNLRALPRYFIAEYQKLGARNFLEEEIRAFAGDYSPVLLRVEKFLPSLEGIATVTARRGADTWVRTDLGSPLVTVGKYGRGKTAVFASDNGYRWASNWLAWNGSRRFWLQMLFAVAPQEREERAYHPTLSADITRESFSVGVRTEEGGFPTWEELWLHPVGRVGERDPLRLARTGLSMYRSSAPLPEAGFYRYLLSSTPDRTGEISLLSVNVPSQLEKIPLPENWELIDEIARETGGKWVRSPDGIIENEFVLDIRQDLLTLCIIAAGFCFLLMETIVTHSSWR